jgi:hypothetical protein
LISERAASRVDGALHGNAQGFAEGAHEFGRDLEMGLGRVQARAFHEGRGQGLQVGVGGAGGRLGLHRASTGPAVQGRVPTGNGGGALAEDAEAALKWTRWSWSWSWCWRERRQRLRQKRWLAQLACADWKMSRSSPLVGSSPSSTTGSAGFRGRRGSGAVAIGAATGAAAGKELVRQLAWQLVRPEPGTGCCVCAAGAMTAPGRPAGLAPLHPVQQAAQAAACAAG